MSFKDNYLIIDLISKPPLSIYDLIDESCTITTGSDESLLQKILKQHAGHENMVILKPQFQKQSFTVRHTAKDVEYNITGFRIKNKDEISDSAHEAIISTGCKEVKVIW